MKRPIETVRAFAAAAGSRSHLLIAGMDGDLSRDKLQAAIPHAIREKVHVVGELSGGALQDSMMASDAFISLSHRENFGYAMCDALAYALPIIVTRGHDILDELPMGPRRQLACGWQLAEDALPSAVEAIADLHACSEAQLTDMGSTGREWATAHLSFQHFRNSLTALIPVV